MKKISLVAGLLVIFFSLVITSVSTKSPICDEASHHIGSGLSYLKTGDFRMNPSAPPLLRVLMALPLLSLDLKLPLDHPSWQTINSSEFNYQFLFVKNSNADRIVFLSRLPMILLSMLFGLAIFLCGKKFFGFKAGIFSLFLYVFSPTILANSGLAMLDMGCAFFVFLTLYMWLRYLKSKTAFNLVLASACLGLALSTKVSALMALPLMVMLLCVDAFDNGASRPSGFGSLHSGVLPRSPTPHRTLKADWCVGKKSWPRTFGFLVLAIVGAFFVLWMTYFFEYKPILKNAPDVAEKVTYIQNFSHSIPFVDKENFAQLLVKVAYTVPIPLGEYVISSLGIGRQVALGDQQLFFLGHLTTGGSKIYYLVDYLIKTPLPEIILLILSFVYIKRRTKLDRLSSAFLMISPIVFFGLASFSKLQGGIRYLIPMYPFLFIWLGDLVNLKVAKHAKVFIASLFGLGVWYCASALAAYPNYLSYFNEATGGINGSGFKITADTDWGQDFKALKIYLDEKGIKSVALYCFGSVDPRYYGINFRELAEDEFIAPRENTYYAISARNLPAVHWAQSVTPVDRVAGTIFIYHVKASNDHAYDK